MTIIWSVNADLGALQGRIHRLDVERGRRPLDQPVPAVYCCAVTGGHDELDGAMFVHAGIAIPAWMPCTVRHRSFISQCQRTARSHQRPGELTFAGLSGCGSRHIGGRMHLFKLGTQMLGGEQIVLAVLFLLHTSCS